EIPTVYVCAIGIPFAVPKVLLPICASVRRTNSTTEARFSSCRSSSQICDALTLRRSVMKWLWTTMMASVAAVALMACDQRIPLGPNVSVSERTSTDVASSNNVAPRISVRTGNGAPSGGHYSLNIIGVPKNKTASMTGDKGHRIFVPLAGTTKIMLIEGPDFGVLDANGTDGAAS